ncbi:MAG: hypothetical protein KGZ32_00100, partial [Dethiobacter sp.]|nr:hypothetical protein [Dethiobacter sp.]
GKLTIKKVCSTGAPGPLLITVGRPACGALYTERTGPPASTFKLGPGPGTDRLSTNSGVSKLEYTRRSSLWKIESA